MSKIISTDHESCNDHVITKKEQEELTPEKVIAELQDGNKRYAAGDITIRNHKAQLQKAVSGQFPKAIILSCVDSRVPVEEVFDCGVGDLFVARVAGNFVNPDILGSMEFACHVSGSKVIVILGHQHCGAVKATIDGVELGNITGMLNNVAPAVEASKGFEGDQVSANTQYVDEVIKKNVQLNLEKIRSNSPILKEMESNGSIKLCGAVFNIEDGKIDFFS